MYRRSAGGANPSQGWAVLLSNPLHLLQGGGHTAFFSVEGHTAISVFFAVCCHAQEGARGSRSVTARGSRSVTARGSRSVAFAGAGEGQGEHRRPQDVVDDDYSDPLAHRLGREDLFEFGPVLGGAWDLANYVFGLQECDRPLGYDLRIVLDVVDHDSIERAETRLVEVLYCWWQW